MSLDTPSFETVYAQLEEAVAVLEQGGLTLEEAVARFESGIQLAALCEALLDAAELRVTQLLAEPVEALAADDEDDGPAF